MSVNNNNDDDDDGGGKQLSTILSVWDDNDINLDDAGGWTCGFCRSTFKGRNATKALAHVAKTPRMHIRMCSAKIPEHRMARND